MMGWAGASVDDSVCGALKRAQDSEELSFAGFRVGRRVCYGRSQMKHHGLSHGANIRLMR